MAISVYDVRGTFTGPRLVLPFRPTAPAGTTRRRIPFVAAGAGVLSVVEAVALLAVALHGLDGLLSAPSGPAGPVLAVGLLALAGWIVLAAGSGAAVLEGSSRRLFTGVAAAELALAVPLGVAAAVVPLVPPAGLPLPVLLLLVVAVPVAKLLLAAAPATTAWLAAGPPAPERRPDPARTHRVLATATLGVIGLALGAVALAGPVDGPARTGETASTSVSHP